MFDIDVKLVLVLVGHSQASVLYTGSSERAGLLTCMTQIPNSWSVTAAIVYNKYIYIYNIVYGISGSGKTFTFCHTIGPDLVLNTNKYLSLVLVIYYIFI